MNRLKLFVPLIVFVVMAIFLWRGLSLDPNRLPSALVGKPLPEFELPVLGRENSAQENKIDREALIGEPFLLNVWATWCPTCINEHPYLIKLQKQGVKIVGLNYKDEDEKAKVWLQRLGDPYALNIVDAEGQLGLNLGVYGAPETFIVDKEGVVRYRHAGDLNERVWAAKMAPIYSSL